MEQSRFATLMENLNIFDFELTERDMQRIAPLNQQDTGLRNFADPDYLRRIIGMFNL